MGTQHAQQTRQVLGQGRLECAGVAGRRMQKRQRPGMERLAGKLAQHVLQFDTGPARRSGPAAIDRVTQQRVISECHMHPDLMRAPGLQTDRERSVRSETFPDQVMGDRRLAPRRYRHPGPHRGMTSNGCIHSASTRQRALANRRIDPLHGSLRQLLYQRLMGNSRTRYNHYPGCILVETVDNTTPGQALQLWSMTNQRIDQCSVCVPRSGVNHDASRLIDDNDILVFIENL